MVTQINLGNFFTSGGKTISGGAGGSGIDTEALIKGLTDAKLVPATKLQDQIKINDGQSAALGEFQTLLSTLKDTVSALRNPPGVGNAADDAFKYRTTSVTTNTGVDGSSYVSVSAAPGSALQNYTIKDITSLAAARKQSTGDINIATAAAAAVSATPAAGQFKAGTFTLNGQSITFNDGESLNSVAAKFNAVSETTGISASIIQVSTGKFQLSFAATETGTANDFDFNNVSPVGTLVDGSGVFSSVTITDKQDAADAEFSFNGVSITRSSNTITDLIDGLTFNQTTVSAPTTKVNVNVTSDQTIVRNSIINFANAYNAVKVFAAKQVDLNADGTYKDTAVLHDSTVFRNTMDSINSQISSIVGGLASGAPRALSDLGITFTDQAATTDTPKVRNVLTVDDTKLESAIASDADAVRRVFEFDFVTDNTSLRVYSRTNALAVSSFTMNIKPSTSTFTATYNPGTGPVTIDMDATPIKNATSGLVTGYSLKGKAGTVLEGLALVYISTSDSTASITATQGIADKIFNIADPALKNDTGSIAVELTSLKDSDARLNDNIAKINAEVDNYRQQLLDQFARMEQAIANVNTLLASINANDNARNSINN